MSVQIVEGMNLRVCAPTRPQLNAEKWQHRLVHKLHKAAFISFQMWIFHAPPTLNHFNMMELQPATHHREPTKANEQIWRQRRLHFYKNRPNQLGFSGKFSEMASHSLFIWCIDSVFT